MSAIKSDKKMKIVYAGGMTISYQILELLCEEGEVPEYVFGYHPSLSYRSNYKPLDDLAQKYGFPLANLKDINDPKAYEILKEIRPDWFMVFGWSQLVKDEFLMIPRFGTLGFHMSKLPEGRGRAPVAWTLIKGKKEGAVSLIWLRSGADTGEIAVQRIFPISIFEDAETLVEKVNNLACEIIREVLNNLREGALPMFPQDESKATYWKKRTPKEGLVNWQMPIRELYNFIRGITYPFPGAFSYLKGEKILFLNVGIVELKISYSPGRIIGPYYSHGRDHDVGIAVAANGGIIIIKRMEESDGHVLAGDSLLEKGKMWQGLQFESEG